VISVFNYSSVETGLPHIEITYDLTRNENYKVPSSSSIIYV